MINYKEPIDINMEYLKVLRYCTSSSTRRGKSYMRFMQLGNALHGIEEMQVQNQTVRCLGNYIDKVQVIRDDSTVWTVYLSNFDSVTPVNVTVV